MKINAEIEYRMIIIEKTAIYLEGFFPI